MVIQRVRPDRLVRVNCGGRGDLHGDPAFLDQIQSDLAAAGMPATDALVVTIPARPAWADGLAGLTANIRQPPLPLPGSPFAAKPARRKPVANTRRRVRGLSRPTINFRKPAEPEPAPVANAHGGVRPLLTPGNPFAKKR